MLGAGEIRGEGRGHTVWVELQNLQVHVCVCDDEAERFLVGEEVACEDFEVVFAAAEEHHLIGLFLVFVSRGRCGRDGGRVTV